MNWTTEAVIAAVLKLHPELGDFARTLTPTKELDVFRTPELELPSCLSSTFSSMTLSVITGPESIRIGWDWKHSDGGSNGKTLSFVKWPYE